MKWMEYWKEERMKWYLSPRNDEKNLRFKEHEQLAHYAQAAFDIEYNTGGDSGASVGAGWKEMEGIHHRGDWDVRRHQKFSKQDLTYFDEESKERFLPYIIETSGRRRPRNPFLSNGCVYGRNPKSEIRNPKQAPKFK